MAKPTLPPLANPMDDRNEMRLCQIYRVDCADNLPLKVINAYNVMREISQRITTSTGTDAFLYAIISMSGVTPPMPETTFMDYVRNGSVSLGSPVLVQFRGKKWEAATYTGSKHGMVHVEMAGTPRELDPSLVKFDEDAVPA